MSIESVGNPSRRVPGIPTKHKHRQYRSRLEARWATFFDLVGWEYEYEPFDLDGWIPDFVLKGKSRHLNDDMSGWLSRDSMVLVEIKPVISFPQDVAEKIARSGWNLEVLILGCSVPVEMTSAFGWLREGSWPEHEVSEGWWAPAILGRWEAAHGMIGFCHALGGYSDRISGHHESSIPSLDDEELARLWAEAGNVVQWKAPR